MARNEVIARVYPISARNNIAIKAIESSKLFVRKSISDGEIAYGHYDRESTAPPVEGCTETDEPYIEARFDMTPRSKHGIVFGRKDHCDVVIDYQNASNYHFSLTFNETGQVIIKDLNSFGGTQVTYDDDGKGARRLFVWIISGYEIPDASKNIIVRIDHKVSFRIVVNEKLDKSLPSYMENVNSFRRGTPSPALEELFRQLDALQETRRATETHTPDEGPIHIKRHLGQGSFAYVMHYWNVSNGDEFALKRPLPNKTPNLKAWEREARIMGKLEHPHIVKLYEAILSPTLGLQLKMEFVPGGRLSDLEYSILQPIETATILMQCLSALAWMHQNRVTHRDIKPDNILVQYHDKTRHDIHVKYGDFGLSNDASHLKTHCGTPIYTAPEVHNRRLEGYTPEVDIWSLGVVLCEIISGLPYMSPPFRHTIWCQDIEEFVRKECALRSDELLQLVAEDMVTCQPKLRSTAEACHQKSLRLRVLVLGESVSTRSDASGITVSSYQASGSTDRAAQSSHRQDSQRRGRGFEQPAIRQNPGRSQSPIPPGPVHHGQLDPYAATSFLAHKRPQDAAYALSKRRCSSETRDRPHITQILANEPRAGRAPSGPSFRAYMEYPANLGPAPSTAVNDRAQQGYGTYRYQDMNWKSPPEHAPTQRPHETPRYAPLPGGYPDGAQNEPRTLPEEYPSELYFDKADLVYMYIHNIAVSMRLSNLRVNGTQIAKVAGMGGGVSTLYAKIRQYGVAERIGNEVWVDFEGGVFLAQKLCVDEALMPLFRHAGCRVPSREENYLMYKVPVPRPAAPTPGYVNRTSPSAGQAQITRDASPRNAAISGYGDVPPSGPGRRSNRDNYSEPSYAEGSYLQPMKTSHLKEVKPMGFRERLKAKLGVESKD